jgi:hypothetical protein
MIRQALFIACVAAFTSLAAAQTLRAPAPVMRTAVTVPSLPEIICRTTTYSSALECKPSGRYACPIEVLYQRGARAPVQVCPAKCAPQSASGASCDCTFVEAECRDRPRGP